MYVVRRGDTFSSIARRFGVDSKSLRAANPGASAKPGQKLVIPGSTDGFDRVARPSLEIPAITGEPVPECVQRGSSGSVVVELQRRLAALGYDPGPADGEFGRGTESALIRFQKTHGLEADGVAGPQTWRKLLDGPRSPEPTAPSGPAEIGPSASRQMSRLLEAALEGSGGQRPGGYCYAAVWRYIEQVGYGRLPEGGDEIPGSYAYQFAEFMNEGDNAARFGLRRLDLDDPYQAPAGAIVVVRAGTPGTGHPIAGDIAIATGEGYFLNDGEMGYGGPENFPPGNDYVLGIYVPA